MQRTHFVMINVIMLALAGVAMACPNCKDSIAATDTAGSPGIASAFNGSIYIMLGAFVGVLGLVTGVLIKAIRGG